MYALITSHSLKELLSNQLPVIVVSLVIAELFYKFQSFLLETGAFLLTWLVLDFVYNGLRKMIWRSQTEPPGSSGPSE